MVESRRYPELNSVFRNLGRGKFEDVSATAGTDFQRKRVIAALPSGGLDNDGNMDVVVSVLGGGKAVSQRDKEWESLILVRLITQKSNRMAIGAQIRITTSEDGLEQ